MNPAGENIIVLTEGMIGKGWGAKSIADARRFAEMLAKGYNKREDVCYVAVLVAVCRKDSNPANAPVKWEELTSVPSDMGGAQ